jgi:hypothetical protein
MLAGHAAFRSLLVAHDLDDRFDSTDAHGLRAYPSVARLTSEQGRDGPNLARVQVVLADVQMVS